MALGQMNGNWERLFKVVLVMMPIFAAALLAFGTWLVGEAYDCRAFRESGERFSRDDGRVLERSVIENEYQIRSILHMLQEIKEDTESIALKVEGN